MRSSQPITVTLGKQKASLDARLSRGVYSSASEVIRAALRALDREEEVLDQIMRKRIDEALVDPAPDIAAKDVFADLRARHDRRLKDDDGTP